jgi:3-methyladenine DNA glycosylase AlkD
MERWVKDFDNWAICDGCCLHVFRMTPWAHQKARQWSRRKEEFVRRAGYVMIATLAVHDKETNDAVFRKYLHSVMRGAKDDRPYVRKAVNWALRQIGKRNLALNASAIRTGEKIAKIDSRAARWIASDALRELRSAAVQHRLRKAQDRMKRSMVRKGTTQ